MCQFSATPFLLILIFFGSRSTCLKVFGCLFVSKSQPGVGVRDTQTIHIGPGIPESDIKWKIFALNFTNQLDTFTQLFPIQFLRCSHLRRTAKGKILQDPSPLSLLIPKQRRNFHQGWFHTLFGSPLFIFWTFRFVLCWSHFHGSWDNVGPFHMYGSGGEPWFTARVWQWAEKGTIDLWGYFLTARSDSKSISNHFAIGSCGLAKLGVHP